MADFKSKYKPQNVFKKCLKAFLKCKTNVPIFKDQILSLDAYEVLRKK